jgi:hypothetical protein
MTRDNLYWPLDLWHIVLFLRHYVAELSMFKFKIIAMMNMNLHITRS